MKLEILTDSGLFRSYFYFNFTDEDMAANDDGFYSSSIIFYNAFFLKGLPAYVFGSPEFHDNKMLKNFAIVGGSFGKKLEQQVLDAVKMMCEVILKVGINELLFADGIDKKRVINGFPMAKAFATSILQQINDKKLNIRYEHTDPFD